MSYERLKPHERFDSTRHGDDRDRRRDERFDRGRRDRDDRDDRHYRSERRSPPRRPERDDRKDRFDDRRDRHDDNRRGRGGFQRGRGNMTQWRDLDHGAPPALPCFLAQLSSLVDNRSNQQQAAPTEASPEEKLYSLILMLGDKAANSEGSLFLPFALTNRLSSLLIIFILRLALAKNVSGLAGVIGKDLNRWGPFALDNAFACALALPVKTAVYASLLAVLGATNERFAEDVPPLLLSFMVLFYRFCPSFLVLCSLPLPPFLILCFFIRALFLFL